MPNGQKEKGRAGEVEQAARRGSRAPLRKSLGQVVTGEVHPEDPRQRTVTAKAPPDSVAAPKGLRGFPRGVTPDTVLVSEIHRSIQRCVLVTYRQSRTFAYPATNAPKGLLSALLWERRQGTSTATFCISVFSPRFANPFPLLRWNRGCQAIFQGA